MSLAILGSGAIGARLATRSHSAETSTSWSPTSEGRNRSPDFARELGRNITAVVRAGRAPG